jgi:hypothetical protein
MPSKRTVVDNFITCIVEAMVIIISKIVVELYAMYYAKYFP